MSDNLGLWDEAREESNILAAIRFFQRKVELCEAVIDTYFYKFLKDTPTLIYVLVAVVVVPAAVLALLGYILLPGVTPGTCILGGVLAAMFLSTATVPYYNKFFNSCAERKVALSLLNDLEKLYAKDKSADVGFMLDATGNYDLETIKGMIKAAKKKAAAMA